VSKTNEPAAQRAPGNREGFVPRAGIIAFTCGLLLLAAVTLYSLWAFWPLGLEIVPGNPERRRISYLGLTDFTVSTERIYFITVALAGALGGVVHTLRSFSMYVGTRQLRWSWVPFNLLLPVVGALGGTLFYLVFRAGLFSSSTSTSDASPFGFAAIAALVGLFSGAGGGEAEADRQASLHGSSQVPTRPLRRGDQTRDTHEHVLRCPPRLATLTQPRPPSPSGRVGSSLAVSAWP